MFNMLITHPVKTKYELGEIGVLGGVITVRSHLANNLCGIQLTKENACRLVRELIKEYDLKNGDLGTFMYGAMNKNSAQELVQNLITEFKLPYM